VVGSRVDSAGGQPDDAARVTRRLTVEVHDAAAISPTVRVLRLRPVKHPEPVTWVPGQFVDLMVPTKRLAQKRSYSIASADLLEIAVTRVEGGQTSVALHEMALGAKMEMVGPRGSFTRAATREEPAVLIGTGTGVAPLRAMVQEELRRGDVGPPLALLFGARTERDLLWGEELMALSARHPRFRYEPTLSKGATDWTGKRGWVQTHVVEAVRALPGARVYLCGLREMIDGVVGVLEREMAETRGRVHIEEYD
jgi:NAD(P)H-flavin reductase